MNPSFFDDDEDDDHSYYYTITKREVFSDIELLTLPICYNGHL